MFGPRGVGFLLGELSWFLSVNLVLVAAAKYWSRQAWRLTAGSEDMLHNCLFHGEPVKQ